MADILLSNQTSSIHNFRGLNGVKLNNLSCEKTEMLAANTPYLLGEDITGMDVHLANQLSMPDIAKKITDFAVYFGDETLDIMSELTHQLELSAVPMMGASTSVYSGRMNNLGEQIKRYQDALLKFRDASKVKSPQTVMLKQQAKIAYDQLQRQFAHEMTVINSTVKSRRGTPLSQVDRGLNIAKDSRHIAKLDLYSQAKVNNLIKFSKHANYLGNGLVLIDVGTRVGNINHAYQIGDNWEREMFKESSSFAASASISLIAVNSSIVLLPLLTPFGWVALLSGGVALAGASAYAAYNTDKFIKNNADSVYSKIMDLLN